MNILVLIIWCLKVL